MPSLMTNTYNGNNVENVKKYLAILIARQRDVHSFSASLNRRSNRAPSDHDRLPAGQAFSRSPSADRIHLKEKQKETHWVSKTVHLMPKTSLSTAPKIIFSACASPSSASLYFRKRTPTSISSKEINQERARGIHSFERRIFYDLFTKRERTHTSLHLPRKH